MEESSKSIIKHIPDFLDYCKVEKDLSNNTRKNYQRYLNKFVVWLKKNDKENIKPHQLSSDDIWKYRLFLSRNINPKTGKSLKKTTQNYYLIALRALLSYFSTRDVVSLPVLKVSLPELKKEEKQPVNYLNLEQVKKLISLPNTKIESGLRDQVVLGILISSGLKVRQLI
ncbi:unnamed protein product, partial [marine sediment metagenome]